MFMKLNLNKTAATVKASVCGVMLQLCSSSNKKDEIEAIKCA